MGCPLLTPDGASAGCVAPVVRPLAPPLQPAARAASESSRAQAIPRANRSMRFPYALSMGRDSGLRQSVKERPVEPGAAQLWRVARPLGRFTPGQAAATGLAHQLLH